MKKNSVTVCSFLIAGFSLSVLMSSVTRTFEHQSFLSLLYLKHRDIIFWVILNVGVVLFWRGSWGLMDLYVFPKSIKKSYAVSLFVGIFFLVVAYVVSNGTVGM